MNTNINNFLSLRERRLAKLRAEAKPMKAAGGAGETPVPAVTSERRPIRGSPNLANLFNEARTRKNATLLGKGGYGSVRRVTRHGRNYALKRVIFNNSVHKNNGIRVTPIKLFESEMNVLNSMKSNPSAVHVVNAFQTDKNAYILTELLDPSSGFSLANISYHINNISFRLLQTIVRNLLSGLDNIHELGYLHLDIKPENIWIFKDGKIKYLDFGIACKMPCKLEFFPGTKGYRKNTTPKVGSNFVFDKTNDFHGLGITLQKTAEEFDDDSDESKYLLSIGQALLGLGPKQHASDVLGGALRPFKPAITSLMNGNNNEGGGGAIRVNARRLNMIPKTRKVSKNVIRKRAIDEGYPENMINNNVLKDFLGVQEELENK